MTLEKAIEKHGKHIRAIPVDKPKYWEMLDMYMANCLHDVVGHPKDSTICFDFYEKMGDFWLAYKPIPEGTSAWDVSEPLPEPINQGYNHE